jgi:hypothetical protein
MAAEIGRVDRTLTAFLDEWTARTKRRYAVGDSLEQLEGIVAEDAGGRIRLDDRLRELAAWLDRHGDAIVDRGVQRRELEVLVSATERLVRLREAEERPAADDSGLNPEDLIDRLVALIRRGTAELGLEYTPAGLVETSETSRRESERVRRSLLERLQGFEDVKAAYGRALDFQKERLAYFYQENEHLLTVLDYQLKNLEARPNPDDELFAASLLYFLHQHNYQVAPYLSRFRRLVGESHLPEIWGKPQS